MTPARFLLPLALLGVLPLLIAGRVPRSAFPDAPPPGHTGGFDEPSCATCHFGESGDSAGELRISGLPERYRPGESYRLVLTLRHPELRRGGFQLAARFAAGPSAGRQAGELSASDARSAVTVYDAVQYAHQTGAGTEPVGEAKSRWELTWTAPTEAAGPVSFHLAGNAANGDDSQLGDRIYSDSARVEPDAVASAGSGSAGSRH